jgi:hypothetical protein
VTVYERCGKCELIEDLLHGLSQPLTALQVGLEISPWQDKDVPQLRARVQSALEIAQRLHYQLRDFRELIGAEHTESSMR